MKSSISIIKVIAVLLIMQSCVSQKVWVRSELEEKFNANYNKFMEDKGVAEDPDYKIEAYFDEQEIKKEYKIITYNNISTSIPFGIFYKNRWWNKYRLHSYLHHAYCTSIWEYADGFIAEPEIGTIKFFQYSNTKKKIFDKLPVFPTQHSFTVGLTKPPGWYSKPSTNYSGLGFGFNGLYSIGRDIHCLKNIRHEFGFHYGIRSYKHQQGNDYNKEGNSFFGIKYRWVHSYPIAEYFSNAFNIYSKSPKKVNFYFEYAPVFHLANRVTYVNKYYEDDIKTTYTYKDIENNWFIFGLYGAIRHQLMENMDLIIGTELNFISLFTSSRENSYKNGKRTHQGNPERNKLQIRLEDFTVPNISEKFYTGPIFISLKIDLGGPKPNKNNE